MSKNSFVSYIFCDNNYRVAFGNCGSWSNTRFLEIEYTNLGEVLHYYGINHKDLEQKFRIYTSVITDRENKKEYQFFNGNEKLKDLLNQYDKLGNDFDHPVNCNCIACNSFFSTMYMNDTIARVIKEFEALDSE